jgi:hypothetical protein
VRQTEPRSEVGVWTSAPEINKITAGQTLTTALHPRQASNPPSNAEEVPTLTAAPTATVTCIIGGCAPPGVPAEAGGFEARQRREQLAGSRHGSTP